MTMQNTEVTFKPDQIGFASVVKVYHKDKYTGRIVFNERGFLEYHEKGSKNMVQYKSFNDKDKIRQYVIDRINNQLEDDSIGKEFVYQGRIAVCAPRKKGQYIQHGISAVMLTPDLKQALLSDKDNWENIQCEIIIRPIKRLGTAKIQNMRLDHAAQALGDDSQWEKK